MRVNYGQSVHGKEEIKAVTKVLKSSTQMGSNVIKLENSIKKLFSKGVKITVSSDDPPFFNASIQGEYNIMKELGLSDQELILLTRNAIDSSFCDKDTKSKLLEKLN